ncbi:hypothetical protein, variant [Aphanomyces astaci]|uniref:TIR domain-containing protein n=1 Tax=Aphanomyces astaci TaxID=112090 RepID=W4FE60_APHAT|nr:hypothetical protein, variant [Aphanomyces astaci]ETV65159.1 hypothetical protein, variant [Aphanomyces astaci]|eukprot:XP_009845363.1 hypothetical protein, variant [Aphanomyces astaci]
MSKRNTFVSKQMQWQLGLVTLINCILLVQVTVFRAYATASETDQSNACNKFNTIRLAVRVFLWTRSSILILPTTGFRYFKMYHVQWATGSLPQDTSGPNIVRTHYLRLCELLALVQIAALLVSTGTIVLRFVQVEWTFTCPTAMDKRIYQICMALSLLVATYCYTISWEFLLSFHKLRTHLLFQHGVFDCKTKSWQEKPFNGSTKELLRFQMWMTVKQRDIDGLRSAIAAAINEDAAFATQWYQSPSIWNQLVCVSRRNPLHMAIKTNQFDMVQLLIQVGFDPNALDKVQVAQFGLRDLYSKVFCFFSINHSEPTRIYGPFGWFKHTLLSPLHVAVARSDHHLVLHLLQAGADPNVSAESNVASAATPPLFWASHVDVTHALLMHGASQLYVPGNGFNVTVFEDAFLNGRHAIARLLESWGGDIALTPLHDAAGRGDVVKMKAYLGWGDVDTMGEHVRIGLFHRTPLHWAAIRGHVNAARMLLKAGAKVNAVDSWHQSPLTWACYLNRTELVREFLVHWQADAQLRDHHGLTIPCLCAPKDTGIDAGIFRLLRKHGLPEFGALENGDTPLHIAIKLCHQDTALALVRSGFSTTSTNAAGVRAVDCSQSTELQFIIKKEAGQRDVMISYSHAFSEFALQLRQSLEDNFLTTWMDLMDPTGIGGGAVWRDEIASGIKHAAVVLCVLSETYPVSQWCMKELAFAKAHNVPVVGVLGETTDMTDELQVVYLWSRQLVDFRQAITSTEPALVVNHDVYNTQLTALLDGLRNEVEKRRLVDRRDVLLSPLTVSVRQTEVEFAYHQRYVFICHGGCHTDFVKRLQGMLKLHGIASYADHQVGGTTHDAILNCSAFLPIFSDKSCRTDAFSDLFAFAVNKEKPIVPIVLSANFFPLAHLYSLSLHTSVVHFNEVLAQSESLTRLVAALPVVCPPLW